MNEHNALYLCVVLQATIPKNANPVTTISGDMMERPKPITF